MIRYSVCQTIVCTTALISELIKLEFDMKLQNQFSMVSEVAEFNCSVHSSFSPTFLWRFAKEGSSVSEIIAVESGSLSSNFSLRNGPRNSVLIVKNVQLSSRGTYTCIVSDNIDTIEAEAMLDLQSKIIKYITIDVVNISSSNLVPPSNLEIVGSNTLGELDTLTLRCSVNAYPATTLIWLKRRSTEEVKVIINSSRTSIINKSSRVSQDGLLISSQSMLAIRNVLSDDSGDYVCEADSRALIAPLTTDVTVNITCKICYST